MTSTNSKKKKGKAQEEMMQRHWLIIFQQQIDAQALSKPMATWKNTPSLPVLLLAWIISLVSCPDCVPSKPISLYTVYLLEAAEWKKNNKEGLDAVQALFSNS